MTNPLFLADEDMPATPYDELDVILDKFHKSKPGDTPTYNLYHEQAKSAINSLTLKQVLELIGEDEDYPEATTDSNWSSEDYDYAHIRDAFRAELRQSAERIWS